MLLDLDKYASLSWKKSLSFLRSHHHFLNDLEFAARFRAGVNHNGDNRRDRSDNNENNSSTNNSNDINHNKHTVVNDDTEYNVYKCLFNNSNSTITFICW